VLFGFLCLLGCVFVGGVDLLFFVLVGVFLFSYGVVGVL
jgi:hypothetical protein